MTDNPSPIIVDVKSVSTHATAKSAKLAIVVEDEKQIVPLIKMILAKNGYDVRVFESGKAATDEAIKLAAEGSSPSLILSDYGLTDGATGGRFLTDARELFPEVPMIMFSGSGEDAQKSIEGEKIAFIPKPFKTSVLIPTIRAAELLVMPPPAETYIKQEAVKPVDNKFNAR